MEEAAMGEAADLNSTAQADTASHVDAASMDDEFEGSNVASTDQKMVPMDEEADATAEPPVSAAEPVPMQEEVPISDVSVPPVEEPAGSLEEAEKKKILGNAAFQEKKLTEALRLYSEAIAQAGAAVPAVYFSNRAVCHAALTDWHSATSDAAEALARPGGVTKKALFQRARAEYKLERSEGVMAALQTASEHGLRGDVEKMLTEQGWKDPSLPTVDLAAQAKEAGTAKYKEGAYREALAEYQRALSLLAEGEVERRVLLLGNCAASCLMLRRAEDCCARCEEALALDPSNAKIRARLATAKLATGDFREARATLGDINRDATLAAAMKQIDEIESKLAAADKMLASGKPAQAISQFAELDSKGLTDCPALALRLGRCYLELKNFPRVLNTTQQVLRVNPRNIDALILRTEALYRNNVAMLDTRQWPEPLEQGQRLLREALSFDPDHSGAQTLRKRLRLLCSKHGELRTAFENREFEAARELVDAMVAESADNPILLARLHCERAKASMRLKDWRTCIKDVGQATYKDHELVQPYYYRATALQALERHEDAVQELEGLFSWHRVQEVYDKLQEAKFLLRKSKRPNYYELLKVPSVASQLEIRKAYRERASEWHPDKKGHLDEEAQKNAEEMFKTIGQANEILTDPVKKELYDKGHDLEGIQEELEKKKRRSDGCGGGFRG